MQGLIDRLYFVPSYFFLFLGGGLATFYYFQFADHGQMIDAQIQQVQSNLEKSKLTLAETKNEVADKNKFESELLGLGEQFQKTVEYLPSQFEIDLILKDFVRESKAAGIQINSIRPQKTVGVDFFEELPIKVQMTGAFNSLSLFYLYLSRIKRILHVGEMEIKVIKILDDSPILEVSTVISTYRFNEAKK